MTPRCCGALLLVVAMAAGRGVSGLEVRITNPPFGGTAFGVVEVEAVVSPTGAARWVEFHVDGERVKTVTQEPYRAQVDVGQENVVHVFRVLAEGKAGERAEDSRETRAIQVDGVYDVELQQLYATVVRGGSRVTDLTQESFAIFDEDSHSQRIVAFDAGNLPISAVLLLDSSESMKGEPLDAAIQGGVAFATGLRTADEASVVLFSDRILRQTPFVSDSGVLGRAVQGVQAEGGTTINDHLYLGLNRLESRVGRRVLVLLSDGLDGGSLLPMEEVLWKARRSQAVIYWIRLGAHRCGATTVHPWRSVSQNRQQCRLLRQATEESGGRILAIEEAHELEKAFRDILAELREQYILGFYPSNARNDGQWRRVRLEVAGSYTVRTRGGYVDR